MYKSYRFKWLHKTLFLWSKETAAAKGVKRNISPSLYHLDVGWISKAHSERSEHLFFPALEPNNCIPRAENILTRLLGASPCFNCPYVSGFIIFKPRYKLIHKLHRNNNNNNNNKQRKRKKICIGICGTICGFFRDPWSHMTVDSFSNDSVHTK